MNTDYRKPLAGTQLDYFDTRAAVDAIQPGAYENFPIRHVYSLSSWYVVANLKL